MSRVFFYEDGTPSGAPTSKADAKRFRYPHYVDGTTCQKCGTDSYKFVTTGECVHCANLVAMEFFNYAIGASVFVDIGGPNLMFKRTGNVVPFSTELKAAFEEAVEVFNGERAPAGTDDAKARGHKFVVTEKACRRSGHFGIRDMKGDCVQCTQERETLSPRKAAIAAGAPWYMPSEPCRHCGKVAERRVSNGQCRGCMPATEEDKRRTNDSVMMMNAPELVVSRKQAEALGMGVYRTGDPCKHGHEGYRYVSTRNCVACSRERIKAT